jgi:tetratricopeptide (TPR) repeat protein
MYCLREEYKLAAEYFMKILDYYENHVPNQARLIAKYSIYVARAHNDVDQHTTAINYFERALKNLPENDSQVLKTRWEIAGSYKLLADKCNKESDFLKALEYYEHALGILRQWCPSEVDAIEITESLAKQTRQVMGSNE